MKTLEFCTPDDVVQGRTSKAPSQDVKNTARVRKPRKSKLSRLNPHW